MNVRKQSITTFSSILCSLNGTIFWDGRKISVATLCKPFSAQSSRYLLFTSRDYSHVILTFFTFLSTFPAVCPHPSFFETPDACYETGHFYLELPTTWTLAMVNCMTRIVSQTSALPMKINSQMQQDAVVKSISYTTFRLALNIWTGMKVQRKVFTNRTFSSITWLDEKNRPLPYANFADNQTPAGIACVVLSKKKNYKWITVDCDGNLKAGPVACVAEKGRWLTFESNVMFNALLFIQDTFKCLFVLFVCLFACFKVGISTDKKVYSKRSYTKETKKKRKKRRNVKKRR